MRNNTKNDWSKELDDNEVRNILKYILMLYRIIQEFKIGDKIDQNIEHNLKLNVRNISTTIGRRKNLRISLEAEKILGICIGLPAIERTQRKIENKNLTTLEHKNTVNYLYNELKNATSFTEDDAKIWFDKAIIAIITQEENKKLQEKKWTKNRPDNAYEQLGIKLKNVWV